MTLQCIRSCFATLLFLFHLMVFAPVYVFWHFVLKPLKRVSTHLYWGIDSLLYDVMIMSVASLIDNAGHRVIECGEDIKKLTQEACIVMANHQCPIDIPVMMRAFTGKNSVFQRTMWIMDWIFQFAPFGWVSKGHGDYFLMQPMDAKNFSYFGTTYFTNKLNQQETRLSGSTCAKN